MRRRDFIKVIAGSTAALPLVARAQSEPVRRIGVLMPVEDADLRASYAAFVEALQRLGWTDGRNVQIETRWAGGHASDFRRHATDLVAFAPEVIVAIGTGSVEALLKATHTVPIVFGSVAFRRRCSLAPTRSLNSYYNLGSSHVCFAPKRTSLVALHMSAFGGKANID